MPKHTHTRNKPEHKSQTVSNGEWEQRTSQEERWSRSATQPLLRISAANQEADGRTRPKEWGSSGSPNDDSVL